MGENCHRFVMPHVNSILRKKQWLSNMARRGKFGRRIANTARRFMFEVEREQETVESFFDRYKEAFGYVDVPASAKRALEPFDNPNIRDKGASSSDSDSSSDSESSSDSD